MGKTTTENEKLNRKLCVEKDEFETKFWGRKKRNKEGKYDEDQKVQHQTVSEIKRYVLVLLYSTK